MPAGDDEPPTPAQAEAARAEQEKHALALLDEVVAELPTLKLVENRIRFQMTVATLLWERDPERARALFKEAQDSLVVLINTADPADPQYHNTMPMLSQMRHEILSLLANRDPQAALNFLRATRQPAATQPNYEFRPPDEETALELNLAGQIAAQDPKQALRLAEESLSKGITGGLIGVIHQLRTTDAEAARRLTTSIVQKLRTADFSKDYEATNVATNLLMTTRPNIVATNTTTAATGAATEPSTLLIDEQTRRDLIDTVAGAVTNGTSRRMNEMLARTLQEMLPEVEKSAPTRMAALRRRLAEFDRTTDPRAKMWREQQNVLQNGTTEAILEAAQKAPPEMRENLYSQAIWKALAQGDFDGARQIVGNLPHPQQRAFMLKEIERQMSWRAVERGNLEEAQKLVAQVASVEERVPMLIGLSNAAAGKKLKKEARAFLEEARGLIDGRVANHVQFNLKLQIAQAYAEIEPTRGFEMLEGAIDHLNELIDAAAKLNGFGGQDVFKDGEMKAQSGYMWNELIRASATGLTALSRTDFDRARAATERFERADVRVIARLAMVQAMLGQPTAMQQKRHGRPVAIDRSSLTNMRIELMPAADH
jgi:hypothetical protein